MMTSTHSTPDPALPLRDIQAVILDMDGVLWRGDVPLDGLLPFFDFLHDSAIPFALATNNSSKRVSDYLGKLGRMGLAHAGPEHIVTSAVATAAYLKQEYPDASARVHVLGGIGLQAAVDDAGFRQVDENADVVVVGLDWGLTYDKLRRATYLIRAGARFIATNGDRTYPTPEGLAPGAGSLVAALEAATDQTPLIVGKPGTVMFQMALQRLGTQPEQTLMVGDRLETDILGGQRAGLHTALVLTGVTTPEQLNGHSIQPGMTFSGLPALQAAWMQARHNTQAQPGTQN